MALSNDNIFQQISIRIIKEQEMIIGPLALEEAKKVPGISFLDQEKKKISFNSNPKEIINHLVVQYEKLFGSVSREVSRDAVRDLLAEIPAEEIPSTLK